MLALYEGQVDTSKAASAMKCVRIHTRTYQQIWVSEQVSKAKGLEGI